MLCCAAAAAPHSTGITPRPCLCAQQEFKLAWLAGNAQGQLEALARARALPAFGAQHFAMAAAWARAGQPAGAQPCTDVIKAALEGRLQRLTAQAPMECAQVAEVRQGAPAGPAHAAVAAIVCVRSYAPASKPAGSQPSCPFHCTASSAVHSTATAPCAVPFCTRPSPLADAALPHRADARRRRPAALAGRGLRAAVR